MNNLKKAALAGSVLAAMAMVNDASATAVSSGQVILGCAVPANTTAAATVYSIDAYDNNAAALTGLPTWLVQGASCSRAVNWLLNTSGGNLPLATVTNQVANGGYTLQSFFFGPQWAANASQIPAAAANSTISMIGCAAPAAGTAGAAVYSVDTQNSTAGTANGLTLSALAGTPCSSALAQTGATKLGAVVNMRTVDGVYSLQQYIVQ